MLRRINTLFIVLAIWSQCLVPAFPSVAGGADPNLFFLSSGPNSGSSFGNVDTSPSGGDWTSPSSAGASDDTYTTWSWGSPARSKYLASTNFSFSIPAGATIDGIVVDVERKCDIASKAIDNAVYLTKNGTVAVGSNKAKFFPAYPTTDTYTTYGTSSDLWGTTWTAEEINSANFGLLFQSIPDTDAAFTVSVDHIRITVYYTLTPTITVSTSSLSDFGTVIAGASSSQSSYTVSGVNLTANIAVTAPTDFQVSTTSGSGFTSSVTLTQSGGTVSTTTIYSRFSPGSAGAKSGNITHTSTGATTKNVAVTGTGLVANSGKGFFRLFP